MLWGLCFVSKCYSLFRSLLIELFSFKQCNRLINFLNRVIKSIISYFGVRLCRFSLYCTFQAHVCSSCIVFSLFPTNFFDCLDDKKFMSSLVDNDIRGLLFDIGVGIILLYIFMGEVVLADH